MSNAASGKVCVACGESCENRPRVKDPKGRYFCRPCYEKALQKKRRQGKSKPADRSAHESTGADDDLSASSSDASRPARAPASIGAADWGKGLADDLDADDPSEAGAGDGDGDATAASAAGVCPNCGTDFPLAAVICVNCGYNTTTGHTVEAKLGGTVVAKEDVPTNTIWPSIIGILAMLVGIGTAGLTVWGMVDLLLAGGEVATVEGVEIDPTWNLILSSILAVPFLCLMLWHSFAGIGLIQRREWGHRQMVLWAKTVITIVGVVAILLIGLLAVLAVLAGTLMEFLIILTFAVIGTGIYLAWPIFLLLWMNRDQIVAEVEEWE